MNDTENRMSRDWYREHAAAYAEVLRAYATHPAAADDEPATTENLSWLRATLMHPEQPVDEQTAMQELTEVYHALGHIALSIRAHARAAYREDALYQRVNALRPPMVRARVTMNF